MEASLTVLYHEEQEHYKERLGSEYYPVDQYVRVAVRCWRSDKHTDIVLETNVMVNGDVVVDKRSVLEEYKPEAHYIRTGIRHFDDLVASHPVFGCASEG